MPAHGRRLRRQGIAVGDVGGVGRHRRIEIEAAGQAARRPRRRHARHRQTALLLYEYEVGYDADGKILAAKVDMTLRAGFSADLSGPVATRAVCHFDNTYYLSDVEIGAGCGKTNTQSNTAFRGFGGPQGAIATEYIIDEIARNLGRDAL